MSRARYETMPERVRVIAERVCADKGVKLLTILSVLTTQKICRIRDEAISSIVDEIRINGNPPSLVQMGLWFGRHHTSILDSLKRHAARRGLLYSSQRLCTNGQRRKARAESLERRKAWSSTTPRLAVNQWPGRVDASGG